MNNEQTARDHFNLNYEQLVYDFVERHKYVIKKYIKIKSDIEIDEVAELFALKMLGYTYKKIDGEFELVARDIPKSLKEALFNERYGYLKTSLKNFVINFNNLKANRENYDMLLHNTETVEMIPEFSPTKINGDFDTLNPHIIDYIKQENDGDVLGLLLLYLDTVQTDKDYDFGLSSDSKYYRTRKTKEALMKLIETKLPHIDFERIRHKVSFKKMLLNFIRGNHSELKYNLSQAESKAEKNRIIDDNLYEVDQMLMGYLYTICPTKFKADNYKGYILRNYDNFAKISRAIENISVYEKEFKEIADFLINYEGEQENASI